MARNIEDSAEELLKQFQKANTAIFHRLQDLIESIKSVPTLDQIGRNLMKSSVLGNKRVITNLNEEIAELSKKDFGPETNELRDKHCASHHKQLVELNQINDQYNKELVSTRATRDQFDAKQKRKSLDQLAKIKAPTGKPFGKDQKSQKARMKELTEDYKQRVHERIQLQMDKAVSRLLGLPMAKKGNAVLKGAEQNVLINLTPSS